MAREKVDNKLNVVIGTKAQIETDTTIPDNSIVIVTDEELTPSDIPNLDAGKITTGTFGADRIPALAPSKITQDANNRFVTDNEKSTWNGKQDALTAGDGISISGNVISSDSGLAVEEWNTVNKTLALSDSNKLIVCGATDTTDQTLTIPTNASVPFPIGTMITFLLFSKSVTFVASSGVTLTSMDSLVTLATKYSMASLIKIDTDFWQLVGALE